MLKRVLILGSILLVPPAMAVDICVLDVTIAADVQNSFSISLPYLTLTDGPFPIQKSLTMDPAIPDKRLAIPAEIKRILSEKGYSLLPHSIGESYHLNLTANSNQMTEDMPIRFGIFARLQKCASNSCEVLWTPDPHSEDLGPNFINSDVELFASWQKILADLPSCR